MREQHRAAPWRVVSIAVLLTCASAWAQPRSGAIIEPGPESAQALEDGKVLAAEAQKLAKQKDYASALPLLEELQREFPAAHHDCLLSLGHLRSGDLTRAQLYSDVAAMRNGDRPEWCTSGLPRELASALRAASYVPVTLSVQPAEATVFFAGVTLRRLPVIWVPAGTWAVQVEAEGFSPGITQIAATPPNANLSLALARLPTAPLISTVDPSPRLEPSEQALATGDWLPSTRDPSRPGTTWPAWTAFGVGGASTAAGAIFHVLATSTRSAANEQFVGTDSFDSSVSRFQRERTAAVAGYAIGATAVGLGILWLATQGEDTPSP